MDGCWESECDYTSKKERDTVQSSSLAIFDKCSVGWAGSPRMSFICEFPAIFGVSEGLAFMISPCSAEFYFERTFGDMPSELALYVAPHGSSRLDCCMRAFTRVMKPLWQGRLLGLLRRNSDLRLG